MAVVDIFADAGMLAYEDGVLPDALAELAIRLDLAGAGPLLAELIATCFTKHTPDGVCPRCGHDKQDPGRPHPKPPPPPPPPPKGQ